MKPFREELAFVSHTTELNAQFKVELTATFNEEYEEIVLTNQIEWIQTPAFNCFQVELVSESGQTSSGITIINGEQNSITSLISPILKIDKRVSRFLDPVYIRAKTIPGNNFSEIIKVLVTVCGNEKVEIN